MCWWLLFTFSPCCQVQHNERLNFLCMCITVTLGTNGSCWQQVWFGRRASGRERSRSKLVKTVGELVGYQYGSMCWWYEPSLTWSPFNSSGCLIYSMGGCCSNTWHSSYYLGKSKYIWCVTGRGKLPCYSIIVTFDSQFLAEYRIAGNFRWCKFSRICFVNP